MTHEEIMESDTQRPREEDGRYIYNPSDTKGER